MSIVKKFTILVITAIVICINGIIFLANDKFSLSIDITVNKLYEISEVTEEVLQNLQSDTIHITVLSDENDYIFAIQELLKKYDAFEVVEVSYVDPYSNPLVVDSFRQRGFQVAEGDIFISGNTRTKQISVEDLFVFDDAGSSVVEVQAENVITNALIYVDSEQSVSAVFIEGHGERPSVELLSLFEQSNFSVSRTSLEIGTLDESTDVIVIASPSRDLSMDEVTIIDQYVRQGGSLLVFLEPTTKSLDNLEILINQWGIGNKNSLVYDTSAHVANNPINIIPIYFQHSITETFQNNAYFVVMPNSTALYQLNNYELDIKPVLLSSSTSYEKDSNKGTTEGPFFLAMTSELELSEHNTAKVFVAGSRKIYSDDLLQAENYGNKDFLSQTINWLTASESVVSIHSKSMQATPIVVLPAGQRLWTIMCMVIIPGVVLLIGVAMYVRRKKL